MTTARPAPSGQLSPPPSPTHRRSPTPDASASHPRLATDADRKRAQSFGEQTPRASARPLGGELGPNSGPRSMFGGAGGGPAVGLPRKDSSLAVSSQLTSGRASPSLSVASSRPVTRHASNPGPPSRPMRASSGSGSTQTTSPLKTLDSYNARNVAAALENSSEGRPVDDVWQGVCIRVLPLL